MSGRPGLGGAAPSRHRGASSSGKCVDLPDVHDARRHGGVQHSAGRRLAHRLHAAWQERVGARQGWGVGRDPWGPRAPTSRRAEQSRRRRRWVSCFSAPDGRHEGSTHYRDAAEAPGGQHAQRLLAATGGGARGVSRCTGASPVTGSGAATTKPAHARRSAPTPGALTALSGTPTQPRCTLEPLPTARVP